MGSMGGMCPSIDHTGWWCTPTLSNLYCQHVRAFSDNVAQTCLSLGRACGPMQLTKGTFLCPMPLLHLPQHNTMLDCNTSTSAVVCVLRVCVTAPCVHARQIPRGEARGEQGARPTLQCPRADKSVLPECNRTQTHPLTSPWPAHL